MNGNYWFDLIDDKLKSHVYCGGCLRRDVLVKRRGPESLLITLLLVPY